MTSLWEVVGGQIGSPPLLRPLPYRRSPAWEQFCTSLSHFAVSPGSLDRRGPAWVYRRLHSQTPPARLSWNTLLGDLIHATAPALSLLLADRPSPSQITVLSWNARWIVDPHSGPSVAKRNLISRFLAKGQTWMRRSGSTGCCCATSIGRRLLLQLTCRDRLYPVPPLPQADAEASPLSFLQTTN